MGRNRGLLPYLLLLIGVACASAPGAAESIYGEAPQLAEMVATGALPPVEERLPGNPVVIQPVERAGVYGGVWHMGIRGYQDRALLRRTTQYETLVRWDPGWTRVIPNVAQSFEVNKNSTEFTFHLREGMRWSNGAPFTADDIMLYFEMKENEEYNPSHKYPSWLTSGGASVLVDKVDNYTVVFRFAEPYGLFPRFLAHPDAHWILTPSHYMRQFHPDYNPEGIDALIDEAGVEDWVELWRVKGNSYVNPEFPTLDAWLLPDGFPAEGVEQVRAVRNPYYWKIDTDFNQLPYIDELIFEVREDDDALVALAQQGGIDMQCYRISGREAFATLEANMEAGGYHFFHTVSGYSARNAISLNLTHADPEMREIFQDKDFRIGLSHAIDRQAIIDQIYCGEGEPFQVAPRPESPYYHEQLAHQYTQYDLDLANEYMDRAGFAAYDADGYRLGPDGEPISFTTLFSVANHPDEVSALEMVLEDWRSVGIDVGMEFVNYEQLLAHRRENSYDAIGHTADGWNLLMYPHTFVPTDPWRQGYARAWALWYTDGIEHEGAEEPPEPVRQQLALCDRLAATSDPVEQATLMTAILTISADQFYSIGINLAPAGYGLVKDHFRNVPAVMPASWAYPTPAPTNPCQYFIEPQG